VDYLSKSGKAGWRYATINMDEQQDETTSGSLDNGSSHNDGQQHGVNGSSMTA
jgi:hypothetical protein